MFIHYYISNCFYQQQTQKTHLAKNKFKSFTVKKIYVQQKTPKYWTLITF